MITVLLIDRIGNNEQINTDLEERISRQVKSHMLGPA